MPSNAQADVDLAVSPQSEALKLLLDTALDAVIVMRGDGVVADWNDRAVRVFGWTREDAVGRVMADLIIPERYREPHRSALTRYLETRRPTVIGQRIEVSAMRKSGEEFPVELSIAPIPGPAMLFVGCLRDLTERNALRQARAEVARNTQRMAMGEMAASIVHEINQPLAAIVTNANAAMRWLAQASPDLEEARAALKRITSDSGRATDVISEIRLMFKHDGVAMAPLDLNDLVREVLVLVRGEVERQRVLVRTELAEGLPRISANLVQLRQVLVNLIVNATDAMSAVADRPRVLSLRSAIHDPDRLSLTIADTGTGIDPGIVESIFDPFFTTKSHGMGMGLSICRSIVENHGGQLSVSAGQPHGATFNLLLPTRAASR
jgi:two-component system, LuxR family, sensor kinase FixL